MSDTPNMQILSDAELDAVAAGASATLGLSNIFAAGPGSADVSATDVVVSTTVVGGLAPSNTANVSGTFTARSNGAAGTTTT